MIELEKMVMKLCVVELLSARASLQTAKQPTTLKARARRGHHNDEVAHSEAPELVGAAMIRAYVACNKLICVMEGSY